MDWCQNLEYIPWILWCPDVCSCEWWLMTLVAGIIDGPKPWAIFVCFLFSRLNRPGKLIWGYVNLGCRYLAPLQLLFTRDGHAPYTHIKWKHKKRCYRNFGRRGVERIYRLWACILCTGMHPILRAALALLFCWMMDIISAFALISFFFFSAAPPAYQATKPGEIEGRNLHLIVPRYTYCATKQGLAESQFDS